MASKEDLNAHFLYKERLDRIVTAKDDEKVVVRKARFLKPCTRSVSEAVKVPNDPLLWEVFCERGTEWPSDVLFKGWKYPQRKWEKWVNLLSIKYAAIWNKAGIFNAIMNSTYEIKCSSHLLLALVEFWCPEINTFVFPWGEATITLEDMMILGGFPVLGLPVTTPITKGLFRDVQALYEQLSLISKSKAKRASHCYWLKHFMEEENEFEHLAFLSLWLSRYVFPSPPEDTIKAYVFPVALHLSKGTKLALAPALLASLYDNLSLLKDKAVNGSKSHKVWGLFQIVQLWAFERFQLLRPRSPIGLCSGEPRVALWHKVNSTITLPLVRSVIKLAENFEWRPYATDLKNWHHMSYYKETEQLIDDCSSLDEELKSFVICMCASKLVGLDYCTANYMPHRVAMQFGLDQDLPGEFFCIDLKWEDLCFYIPSRTFKAGVSRRYLKWWKESNMARQIEILGLFEEDETLLQSDNNNMDNYDSRFQSDSEESPGSESSDTLNLSSIKNMLEKSKKFNDYNNGFEIPDLSSGTKRKLSTSSEERQSGVAAEKQSRGSQRAEKGEAAGGISSDFSMDVKKCLKTTRNELKTLKNCLIDIEQRFKTMEKVLNDYEGTKRRHKSG